ncbi:MAG TPA: hypothetical protein VNN25_00195 [Thermoanaerobaculia bacterium]|nr:hypothetical protein [Thermoanaerobaculia bacterium]
MGHVARCLAVIFVCCSLRAQVIQTIAGGGTNDGQLAAGTPLASPTDVGFDRAGNLYIAESGLHRVRRVDALTKTITTIAGSGQRGFAGDGGTATAALLADPEAVAIDTNGDIYIADVSNNRIRRVNAATGIITTLPVANLNAPVEIALDGAGSLYILDNGHQRILRVNTSTYAVATIAGNGSNGYSGDGSQATAAALNYPRGLTIDGTGNVYIADTANQRIRRIDAATNMISTVAGNGTVGDSGDGGAALSAALNYPSSVAVDSSGNFYIADADNARVRRVDGASKIITIVPTAPLSYSIGVAVDTRGALYVTDAGKGSVLTIDAIVAGGSGDGMPATAATLSLPRGLAVDATGSLYIADRFHHRIRRVDATTRIITTVAGTGEPGFSGDGGPALSAQLQTPFAVAFDRAGNLLIADDDNYRIRRVDAATGTITTIAGNGIDGFGGDGGQATSASIGEPSGVAVDSDGNVYIADPFNSRIRRVDAKTHVITTFAGSIDASGVAVDRADNVYIANAGSNTIVKIARTGAITPVAGNGQLRDPVAVAVDAAGNLYIADRGNSRICKLDATTNAITTIAGTAIEGFFGDGLIATGAQLNRPEGIAVDDNGNVYIADTSNDRVRIVTNAINGTRRRAARH